MKIDGGCFCGEVTFEAQVEPGHVLICHCTDCQRMSGSAFRTIVPAPADRFRLISGAPKTFVKVADSGNRRVNAFCATCGTQLWSSVEGKPSAPIAIRAGTVTQRDQLPPQRQIWRRSAQSWLAGIDALPSRDTQR